MALQVTKSLWEKNLLSQSPLWQVVPDIGTGAIGIFDSGIGGITVLAALAHQFPGEKFLYYADTVAQLYGTKSQEEIIARSLHCLSYLQNRDVKAILVACHTASLLCGTLLQERAHVLYQDMTNATVCATRETTKVGRVALWGTDATIATQFYQNGFRNGHPSVHCLASPLSSLVPWIENRENMFSIRKQLQREREKLHQCDTLVLACTHFPLISPLIREVIGEDIALVNPAHSLVQQCTKYFSPESSKTTLPLVEWASSGDRELFLQKLLPYCEVSLCTTM